MIAADAGDLKPGIGRMQRSIRLFRYLLLRLHPAPGVILQAICSVTGRDGFMVDLTTVDNNAVRPAMTWKRFPEEPCPTPKLLLAGDLEGQIEAFIATTTIGVTMRASTM